MHPLFCKATGDHPIGFSMHAKELFICLANAVFVAGDKLVMVSATFEPPIRAKTEENQKSAWREDHILFPEPVVPEQKTGIVSVAESHPVDVKAASRTGRRLQASCPSPPPPAPVFIPAYCPAYPALPLLDSTMGFSGIPSIPSLLPGQQNATTGTFIDSGGVFEWTFGCPVAINLGSSESLYTKVFVQPRWKLKYAWETSQTFIMFPHWYQIPYLIPGVDSSYSTYNWLSSLSSEFTFQPVPTTFQDFYHRSPTWVRAAREAPAARAAQQ
jgi:hypothetical protein